MMAGYRGQSGNGWQVRRLDSATHLGFTVRGATPEDTESNSDVRLNDWMHIVCVYDSVNHTKRIYFDGVQDQMAATTGNYAGATAFNTYIGARGFSPAGSMMFATIVVFWTAQRFRKS
jgi:hypothetical protein